MTAELQVDTCPGRAETIVTLRGEVDRANAGWLRQQLDRVGGGGPLAVDVTGLTYLDSSGIAVLFDRLARGDVRLVAGPGCLVRTVFEVTGLPLAEP